MSPMIWMMLLDETIPFGWRKLGEAFRPTGITGLMN
jgi:hypothetical protein